VSDGSWTTWIVELVGSPDSGSLNVNDSDSGSVW